MTDLWSHAIDSGKIIGTVLVDIKKAFVHSAVYILFWSFEISDNILRNQK